MRRRRVVVLLASAFVIVVVLVVLNLLSLWQINGESGTYSMAPTLPPCSGQVLASDRHSW